jgi:hypothetical protein
MRLIVPVVPALVTSRKPTRLLRSIRTRPGTLRSAAIADFCPISTPLRTGRLRASVEHLVDLDDVARAHQLAEFEGRGKVVVDLTGS